MNKYRNIIIVTAITALVFIVSGIFLLTNRAVENGSHSGAIKVAATIFPIYDIARNIAGDHAVVELVLPPGNSPHTFTLTPERVKALQGVQAIFMVGDLDEWGQLVAQNVSGAKAIEVHGGINLKEPGEEDHADAEAGEHSHENFDPHYWLSVDNAKIIAHNIAQVLIVLDPENQNYYQDRLDAYEAKLTALNSEVKSTLSGVSNRNLITFHDSWAYFADAYGLSVVAVFEPSPGQEPTPSYLHNIFTAAQQYNIKAIFSEPQLPSDILRPFIQDLGLTLYVLDPLGGQEGRNSYIDMMRYNANTIRTALLR